MGRWALAESSLVVVLHDGVKASIAGPGVIGLGVLIDATLDTRDVAQIDARRCMARQLPALLTFT